MWLECVVSLVLIVSCTALLHALPTLTRPDLFFAVTVRPQFRYSDEAHHILTRYRIAVWLNALPALMLALALLTRGHSWGTAPSMLWLLVGTTIARLRARKCVQPYAVAPSTVREAQLLPRPAGASQLLLLSQLVPAGSLLAAAVLLWQRPATPDVTDRHALAGLLLAMTFSCAVMALFAYLMLHARRIAASGERAHAEQRFRRVGVAMLLAIEHVEALFCLALLLQRGPAARWLLPAMSTVMGTIGFGGVIMLARLGQGGTRQSPALPVGAAPIGDRTADEYWRRGFYYNPDDPALLVEKRFGIGWTLNMGHRASWVIAAFVFGAPLGITVWLLATR